MSDRFSVFVGGGNDYHGPTAKRDQEVVEMTARELYRATQGRVQVVTGGTAGVPDDFAKAYANGGGTVVDVVSSEYLPQYLERTHSRPRAYLVQGKTQEERRRLACTQNPDIRVALFVQGGKYTAHEIELTQQRGCKVVCFWGSGGASGGELAYDDGYRYQLPEGWRDRPFVSRDARAPPHPIACALVEEILKEEGKI